MLLEELHKDANDSRLDLAYISQPACTAIQLALTDMLASWNVRPSRVMGHSSGEIAAAYAAGILSIEESMKVAYSRGQVTSDFKNMYPKLRGAMIAVGCNQARLQPMLETLKDGRVVVAAVNGPDSLTMSGDEAAIKELQQVIEEQGIFNRKLRVDMAYHSPHMELLAERYIAHLSGILPANASGVEFHSTVTGSKVPSLLLHPAYWVANLISPVRFSDALVSMCKGDVAERVSTLIEVGPHSALEGPIRQTLKGQVKSYSSIEYTPCLLRSRDAVDTTMQLAARLFVRGFPLYLAGVNDPSARRSSKLLSDIPPYPWKHETSYWHESRVTQTQRLKKWPRHDLLGSLVDDTNDVEVEWRNILRLSEVPWVEQHQIQSNCVFPLAGYISMVTEAMRQRTSTRSIPYDAYVFRDVSIARPLTLNPTLDIELRTTLRPRKEGDTTTSDIWDEVKVSSWTKESGWVEHCRCLASVQQASKENPVDGIRQLRAAEKCNATEQAEITQSCCQEIDTTAMYSDLATTGFAPGEVFQGLKRCRASSTCSVAHVSAPDTAPLMPESHESDYIIHPVTLDIIMQILWPIIGAGRIGIETLCLPTSIRELSIAKEPHGTSEDAFQVFARGPPQPLMTEPLEYTFFAKHPKYGDQPYVRAQGYVMTPIRDNSEIPSGNDARGLCYKFSWESKSLLSPQVLETTQQNGTSLANGLSSSSAQDIVIVTLEDSSISNSLDLTQLSDNLRQYTGKDPSLDSIHNATFEGKIVIVLIEIDHPCLSELKSNVFERLKSIIMSSSGIIWPVRSGYQDPASPDLNMVSGFARTIRAETALKFVTIDLDISQNCSPVEAAEIVANVYSRSFLEQSTQAPEMEYMERNGTLLVPRLVPDGGMNDFMRVNIGVGNVGIHPQRYSQPDRPLRLTIERPGSLDSTHFVDDERLVSPISADEIEIEVKAISLNFKDVVIAMGQLPSRMLGQECSGIVTGVGGLVKSINLGDRVCALSPGCLANFARCKASSAICIPEEMSFDLAATLPIVYCTAYYSLMVIGRLAKGEKILIHAAAGGVGQAALGLAQMTGAETFATVGSESKKSFLMENFGLDEDHIFNSRDTSFKEGIMRMTGDRGVDIVLNSLAGDLLHETLACLTSFGRFIEIGKRDIVENTRIAMASFARNVVFASVDLTVVAAERPSLMQTLLNDVMGLYHTQRLRLVSPLTTLPISDIRSAIRTLQGGKSMGKIVVVPSPSDQIMVSAAIIYLTKWQRGKF